MTKPERERSAPQETEGTSGADDSSLRILHALRRIMRAMDIHSRRLAAERDVTSVQLFVMKMLATEEVETATEVARRVHLSPSTVVGIIDRLEEKGLAERSRSSTDRRVVRIQLTESGLKVVENTPHPIEDLLANQRNGLGEDEERRIADGLEMLVALLDADRLDAYTPYGKGGVGEDDALQL
jgi:DNA-binding MarR family transcriptional regulator